MRWAKVVMIALGALIAFIVIESVFHLLQWAFIALVIGAIIAVAVKAHSQYKLMQERRAQVKQDKAARKRQVRDEKPREVAKRREVAPAEVWTAERAVPPAPASTSASVASSGDVDAELERLKREMRS
jgi:membrane protein implicated in regulation of membrane protease activity